MHLSVKLIFTLAGQMTTTGEETHTSRMGRTDWLSSVRHYEKHLSSSGLLKPAQRGPAMGANGPRAKIYSNTSPSLSTWLGDALQLGLFGMIHVYH